MNDLQEAIKVARQAVEATPKDSAYLAERLNNLGNLLGDRFGRTGAMDDLQEAINIARQAVEATPKDSADLTMYLNNLGIRLGYRFWRPGAMDDLQEAINVARQAAEATPKDSDDLAMYLNNLGSLVGNRFKRIGVMDDLQEAINIARQAVKATPKDSAYLAGRLNNLGNRLGDRFRRTGAMEDIQEAINVGRQSVEATPKDSIDLAGRLSSLGIQLGDRFGRTGAIDDLQEAIDVAQQAVDATPKDSAELAIYLNNLGNLLGDRFRWTGAMDDLQKAIDVARQAVEATPKNSADLVMYLNNLGIRLQDRFGRTGAMDDLQEAIDVARQSVEATPKDFTARAGRLNSLGIRLGDRFKRTGAMDDLQEAIKVARQSVEATPKDSIDLAMYLNNLGIRLGHRFERTGAMDDLQEAIDVTRQSVEATPKDSIDLAMYLNNLGNLLGDRFKRTGAMDDLQKAIDVARQAVEATPKDSIDLAMDLNNLGNRLRDRFGKTGTMDDLQEAIDIACQAVEATPKDSADLAMYLNNLGSLLKDRFRRTGAMDDLRASAQYFGAALHQSASPLLDRIRASRNFLLSPFILQDIPKAFKIAQSTIELLSQLAPQSLRNTDKHHLLSQAAGLASNAAAVALLAGRSLSVVTGWLEIGRGVLAGAIQDMRTDISALRQKHPRLAISFQEFRDLLDAPTQPGVSSMGNGSSSARFDTDRRLQAQNRLKDIIEEIRHQPGFERFLLPPPEAEILEAASYGPIVMINVSVHRCDTLILHKSGIKCLELEGITQKQIQDHRGNISSPSSVMLEWLWDGIVSPILGVLGFTQTPSGADWPRVWWVPTGPLVGFPLHAAGYHLAGRGESALDCVVSSYATSLRAIMHTRRQDRRKRVAHSVRSLVLVAMEDTPGLDQRWLQYAAEEIREVQEIGQSMQLSAIQPERRKAVVLSAMSKCEIFHFAGHGSTNALQPLQSRLLLDDWEENSLTVESLLDTNLQHHPPFLAYLSACGSGQVLDDESVDEGIHLSSAFQLAGFRHVIGTLWNVDDSLCVKMARLVYETLKQDGLYDESVSRGLHLASRQLRDEWLQVELDTECKRVQEPMLSRDAELLDESKTSTLSWVPYVHYGV
ncbi:hypothetical protein DL770_008369 [Monosporascus sp. CRB-9-2]|nr:hypothetical protein DL770_008369 [Monosporascus sp. CRB-9-2]